MAAPLCSQCGSPLATGALAGQCPRCLGALAFGLPDPALDAVLQRAGDYEFLRELGRGGMGVVYEALQRSLNRRVAVKMLLAGAWARPEFKPRFRAEAEAAARLRHPGIVTIHEVGEFDGQPFLAMELVAGPSLAELVRPQPLAPRRAAQLVRLVADAIAHAHAAGVLHRDLKPSNVLLDAAGQPRVTDFGLAKQLDSATDLTRSGDLLGSPNYLAPEQVAGAPATAASDLYSLGAILYELLTARPPFAADSVAATLQQVVQAEPVPPSRLNSRVPRDLETICLKCLRKEPARRYGSAAELAADLARFEAGQPILARPVSAGEKFVLWTRRQPVLAGVTFALAAALVLGFVGVLTQWRRAEANRAEMARNLYAADVAAAAAALKERNLGRARELLLRHADEVGSRNSEVRTGESVSLPVSHFALPTLPEFTWRLLWSRCQGDDSATLGEHPWIVTSVAVSPNGQWVASGSQDQPDNATNSLKLWRLESGTGFQPVSGASSPGATHGQDARGDRLEARPTMTLAASNTVWTVAFTADSRTLVSAGVHGVRFWDVATGSARTDLPALRGQEAAVAGDLVVASPNHPFFSSSVLEPLQLLRLGTREVWTLAVRGRHPALSPDGRQLAVLDAERNLQLYDLATERLLFTVATNQLFFRLRFSPDGQRLAAAGQMTSAKVWNLAAPGSAPRLFPSEHNVWDAAFTPDGTRLISATSHQQLEVWDARTAVRTTTLAGHANEVWTVAVTPDGQRLVSGGKDRTVRLWPLTPKPAVPAAPAWRYFRPVFSPDGARLLTYAQTNWRGAATVWATTNLAKREGTVPGFPRGFAPDSRHLLFLGDDGRSVRWREIASGNVARTVELAGAPTNLFAGELVLAGDARSLVCPDEAGTFWRWSTEDGRLLHRWRDDELAGHFVTAFAAAQRPNRLLRSHAASRTGRWLALGPFGTYTGLLVDFETGRAARLRGHRDDLAGLAFSPDERQIASGSVDGTIRLWNVADGRSLAELPGHLESVEAVAFSPDGQTLASVNPGIEVTFWHLPTRRELARLAHPEAGYHVTFSPDGRRLALSATAGNLETDTDRVEVWEVR